jgi:integrase
MERLAGSSATSSLPKFAKCPPADKPKDSLTEDCAASTKALTSHRRLSFFRQFVEEHWKQSVLSAFKPSTIESHSVLLRKHLLPYFGDKRLCDMEASGVQAFITEKAQAGLAWNTVKNLRNLVSRISRTAVEWNLLTINPARGVRLPAKQLSRPRRVITPGELHLVLRELPEPIRTMVLVCAFTGVRAGELFALRWRHVDFERGILQVRESVHRGKFS